MCGIVGYIGNRQALPVLMRGLESLEYRGYDSAGLAYLNNDGMQILKSSGRIDALQQKLENVGPQFAHVGIAHTRWATHGAPTEINAHPHINTEKNIAVVHNGIIENFSELKLWLEKSGHIFVSDTDTEVLAHLISEYYEGDPVTAVRSALSHLRGTYGIAVLFKDKPDSIVAARLGSPIVIGIGENEMLVASDPSALIGSTRRVMYMDDGEIAHIRQDNVSIMTLEQVPVVKKIDAIQWSQGEIQKGGFAHFMLKEIHEQPETVRAAIRGRLSLGGEVKLGAFSDMKTAIKDMRKISIVACGSAYYAGLIGAQLIERLSGIPVVVELASEYRYKKPVMTPRSAFLAVSQSGETADTLAAFRLAKDSGLMTIGIINAVGSTIAREVDAGIYNHAGPEISVASTKAFVSQITVMLLLALALGNERGLEKEEAADIAAALHALPDQIQRTIDLRLQIASIAEEIATTEHIMYLGRTLHYPIALEGALKLKEISYIHAEGYAAGEMKHGPIAMVESGFPVIGLAPNDDVFEKMRSNLEEVHARGSRNYVFTTEGVATDLGRCADRVIELPKTHELLQPILSVVAMQLLAYETAVLRGLDVDRPRNLAKSVTVE